MGTFTVDAEGHTVWKGGASKASSGKPKHSEIISSLSGVGEYTGELLREDPVPAKPVAAMSYGQRVRMARLWESHEEFLG